MLSWHLPRNLSCMRSVLLVSYTLQHQREKAAVKNNFYFTINISKSRICILPSKLVILCYSEKMWCRNEIWVNTLTRKMFTQYYIKTMDRIIKRAMAWIMIKRTATLVSQGCKPTMPWPGVNTQNAGFHEMLYFFKNHKVGIPSMKEE